MAKPLELSRLFESSLKLASSIDSGVLTSALSAIISYSVHEPNQSKSREFLKYFNSSFPMVSCAGSSFSKSRLLRLVLQEGEKKEDIFWELWNSSQILQVKDLKKSHSVLTASPTFGRLAWSYDDKYVLYTAEATSKKSGHFWSGEENTGNGNLYKEHFGEGLKHVTDPRLYIYDIALNEVKEVETPIEVYSAQPCFRPDSDEFVFIGYEKGGYKMGIAAMVNRRTRLFRKTAGGAAEELKLADGFCAAVFPKYSPNGQYLSYLAVPEGTLEHCMCMALVVKDLNTMTDRVIIEVVNDYNENFNGIYGFHETLANYNWLNNDKIAFQTYHDASETIFTVDFNKTISPLDIPLPKPHSCTILDIYDNSILFKVSNPITPDQLYLYNSLNSEMTQLDDCSNKFLQPPEINIKNALANFKTSIIQHESSAIKSVLYHAESNKNLIVLLHGGPHSAGAVSYVASHGLRAVCGFNLLIVNYRGSLGFGNKLLKDLLGNIGSMDVDDCQEAINLSLKISPVDNIITYGGSHGGFLSLHLASRMKLSACVTLNGALDVASMLMATDINDWGYAEALNSDLCLPPTTEQLDRMYQVSPISRIPSIKCPVLIVAGGSDLRVPPSASLAAYRALKSNNKDTKMLWYPDDGHGLLGKATSYDLVVNTIKWMLEKIAD